MANTDIATGALQKGKTRKQLKASRARLQAKVERVENEKVVERSGGRCEAQIDYEDGLPVARCSERATEIHHQIGKWRLRGRGISALSEHKQHVCSDHHRMITGDVWIKLVRVGGTVPFYTDHYKRAW